MSEEKDMHRYCLFNDGSITNDDASLSVDLVKDETLKKESSGKVKVTPSPSISARHTPTTTRSPGCSESRRRVKDLTEHHNHNKRGVTLHAGRDDQDLWDKVYGIGTVSSAEEFEAKVTEEIRQYFSRETGLS